MIPTIPADTSMNTQLTKSDRLAELREASVKLEATFLAEMLKAAGLGETPNSFSGGSGEEQFSSFLREAQAEEMARSGGVGLAEHIFNALKEREDV